MNYISLGDKYYCHQDDTVKVCRLLVSIINSLHSKNGLAYVFKIFLSYFFLNLIAMSNKFAVLVIRESLFKK